MRKIRLSAAVLCAALLLCSCGKNVRQSDSNSYTDIETPTAASSEILFDSDSDPKDSSSYIDKTVSQSDKQTDTDSDASEKASAASVTKKDTDSTKTTSSEVSSKSDVKSESGSESSSAVQSVTVSEIQIVTQEPEDETQTISEGETSAESETEAAETQPPEKHPSPITEIIEIPACRSAALYCVEDGEYLYSDSIDQSVAPASLTKLLTASVVLKNMPFDEVITVGSEQQYVHAGSSLAYVGSGMRMRVYDLLTGMLLCSGNDAAYTAAAVTARYCFPDEELSDLEAINRFCTMMNSLADEIGMTNSHFVTPDGWDEPDQYTTVADLVTLAEYALSIPEISEIVSTQQTNVTAESGNTFYWVNTNLMLDPYSGYYRSDAVGMKTGTTSSAGCCLIGAFKDSDKTYISVVSGCIYSLDRYELTRVILNRAGL